MAQALRTSATGTQCRATGSMRAAAPRVAGPARVQQQQQPCRRVATAAAASRVAGRRAASVVAAAVAEQAAAPQQQASGAQVGCAKGAMSCAGTAVGVRDSQAARDAQLGAKLLRGRMPWQLTWRLPEPSFHTPFCLGTTQRNLRACLTSLRTLLCPRRPAGVVRAGGQR